MRAANLAPGRRQTGFTLLELVVVMFLLGLMYAVTAPALDTGTPGLQLKAATRQLAAGLRKARSVAIADGRDAVLVLDVGRRTFSVTGDPKSYLLAEQIEFSLFTAESEQIQENRAGIRFFPDGTSTGGRITLAAGGAKQSVDVDWVTGRVKIL